MQSAAGTCQGRFRVAVFSAEQYVKDFLQLPLQSNHFDASFLEVSGLLHAGQEGNGCLQHHDGKCQLLYAAIDQEALCAFRFNPPRETWQPAAS